MWLTQVKVGQTAQDSLLSKYVGLWSGRAPAPSLPVPSPVFATFQPHSPPLSSPKGPTPSCPLAFALRGVLLLACLSSFVHSFLFTELLKTFG